MPTFEEIREVAAGLSNPLTEEVNSLLDNNMSRTACSFLKDAIKRRHDRGLISKEEKNKAFRILNKK